jgi:phosphoglycolate phosphatase
MKYDTILFDLDGTLLNTLDDLTDSVNIVMRQEGCPQRTRDEIREFIGDGVKMLMKRSLPPGTSDTKILRCLTKFREVYLENMRNKTRPYEGIPELLKELKAMRIKIGVVSNKPDEATKEMCRQYFGENIDAAIGDNIDRKKKPEPDNVFEALKQLGSDKSKTLYAGDSDVDVKTAKNAGLVCAGVTWGYRSRETLRKAGADHIVDEPQQLIGILKE